MCPTRERNQINLLCFLVIVPNMGKTHHFFVHKHSGNYYPCRLAPNFLLNYLYKAMVTQNAFDGCENIEIKEEINKC